MRIYPGTTVDYEFATLGGLGYTGTLNDRQFAALRAEGLTGSLPDMFGQFDGELSTEPTPSELVEAILLGTNGWAIDPADAALLNGGSIAVSDPVASMLTKYGTAAYTYSQGTAANRPAWSGTSLEHDGLTDLLEGFGANLLAFVNNPMDTTAAIRFVQDDLAAIRGLFHFSVSTSTSPRFTASVQTNGSIQLQYRVVETDATQTLNSAAGVVTAGGPYSLIVHTDWVGLNARAWLNGVEIINAALTASGAASAKSSQRHFWGIRANTNVYSKGPVGRGLFVRKAPTADDRANIGAWLEEVAL